MSEAGYPYWAGRLRNARMQAALLPQTEVWLQHIREVEDALAAGDDAELLSRLNDYAARDADLCQRASRMERVPDEERGLWSELTRIAFYALVNRGRAAHPAMREALENPQTCCAARGWISQALFREGDPGEENSVPRENP